MKIKIPGKNDIEVTSKKQYFTAQELADALKLPQDLVLARTKTGEVVQPHETLSQEEDLTVFPRYEAGGRDV
jgi:hypothetical protein